MPGAELSFDAAARPCYEHRCYNYTAIADAVDRIFVMDYESEPPSARQPVPQRISAPLSLANFWSQKATKQGLPLLLHAEQVHNFVLP